GQNVAHEVHAAALPAGPDERGGDGGLQTEVVIADDELHAGQAASPQTLQEGAPEGAVFAVAHVDAQHFAVTGGRDAGSDHHRPRHDAAADADFDVGGVAEHIRERDVVQR